MKRFWSVLALALVIALGTGSAFAAGKGNKPNKADKQQHKGVAGTVTKIDGTSIIVQTRGKNGAEVTITTDDKTKFEGVNAITDIKPGMRVMATPDTGTAQKVIVREAGKKNAQQ
jgi:hypothetical protein